MLTSAVFFNFFINLYWKAFENAFIVWKIGLMCRMISFEKKNMKSKNFFKNQTKMFACKMAEIFFFTRWPAILFFGEAENYKCFHHEKNILFGSVLYFAGRAGKQKYEPFGFSKKKKSPSPPLFSVMHTL